MAFGQAKLALRWIALVAAFGFVLPEGVEARQTNYSKREVEKFIPEGEYDLNGRHVASSKKSVSRKPAKAKPKARPLRSARSRRPSKSYSPHRTLASKHRKAQKASKSAKKASKYSKTQKRKSPSKWAKRSAKKRPVARSIARTKKRGRAPERRRSYAKKPSTKKSSSRIPYARPTSNERDMPFVSIPKSRVRKDPKTIVMDDPATGARADPEGPSQHEFQTSGWPGESDAGAAPVAREVPSYSEPVTPPAQISAPAAAPEVAAPVAGAGVHEPDTFDLHSGSDPLRGQGRVPAAEAVVAPAPGAPPAIAPIERPSVQ
jgi:hypothetical protein